MLCLAWLPIAQHVFHPALIGRLELILRKIVSSEQEQRLSRCADFTKKCLPRIECKELPRKISRSWAPRLQNSRNRWAKKMGSNMRPQYIQFRDIHDRDRAYTVLCFNLMWPGDAYMPHCTGSSLVQEIVCCLQLCCVKPFSPKLMTIYCQLDPWEQFSLQLESKIQ